MLKRVKDKVCLYSVFIDRTNTARTKNKEIYSKDLRIYTNHRLVKHRP